MICLLKFAPASLQMTADRLHIKPSLLMVHLKKLSWVICHMILTA